VCYMCVVVQAPSCAVAPLDPCSGLGLCLVLGSDYKLGRLPRYACSGLIDFHGVGGLFVELSVL
jgi:hypothetical protein